MKIVNRKIMLVLLVIIEMSCLFFMYQNNTLNETLLEEVVLNLDESNNMFAIMLEQIDGTYVEIKDSTWPSNEVYSFNGARSGCMDVNGNLIENALTYDLANNIASVETGKTSYCYLYFEYLPVPFAIYSEDDNSLRFYKNKDYYKIGEHYNNLSIKEIYIGFENNSYNGSTIPWSEYNSMIETIVVEEEIEPLSIAYWFYNMPNVATINVAKLNTSSVTNMFNTFASAEYNASSLEITGLASWDTSNVAEMSGLFGATGYNVDTFKIEGLENWNVSKVKSIRYIFGNAGYKADSFIVSDLSSWDTSSVTDMSQAFAAAGYNATEWNVGNLSKWNTSNVTNMFMMFASAGYNATEWNIGDLSTKEIITENEGTYTAWETSKVTNMQSVFYYAGYKSTYTLDVSSWHVTNVTNHNTFNTGVESKVIAPTWVN